MNTGMKKNLVRLTLFLGLLVSVNSVFVFQVACIPDALRRADVNKYDDLMKDEEFLAFYGASHRGGVKTYGTDLWAIKSRHDKNPELLKQGDGKKIYKRVYLAWVDHKAAKKKQEKKAAQAAAKQEKDALAAANKAKIERIAEELGPLIDAKNIELAQFVADKKALKATQKYISDALHNMLEHKFPHLLSTARTSELSSLFDKKAGTSQMRKLGKEFTVAGADNFRKRIKQVLGHVRDPYRFAAVPKPATKKLTGQYTKQKYEVTGRTGAVYETALKNIDTAFSQPAAALIESTKSVTNSFLYGAQELTEKVKPQIALYKQKMSLKQRVKAKFKRSS